MRRISLGVLHKPSVAEFASRCFDVQQPAILRGCLGDWPALAAWSDVGAFRAQLLARCGEGALEELVPVEKGSSYSAADFERGHLPLGLFLDFMQQFEDAQEAAAAQQQQQQQQQQQPRQRELPPPLYLAQHDLLEQLPQLAEDVRTPPYCALGKGDAYGCNAWLGPGGTVSPLHRDPYHSSLSQLGGRKLVRLFAPEHAAALYAGGIAAAGGGGGGGVQPNTSAIDAGVLDGFGGGGGVDLGGVDLGMFPRFGEIESFLEGELRPGDALFIPKGWWHYVRALSTSFSVNHWWL